MAQLIVEIPESIYERLQQWATYSASSVQEIFIHWAEQNLPEIFQSMPDVTQLPEQELLRLARSTMTDQEDHRLVELRSKDTLTNLEEVELRDLQRRYWFGQYVKNRGDDRSAQTRTT